MNVLSSIAILGLLIFFHELGHFFAATIQGIKVNGFSIGFGPAIIQKKIKEVTYSLRALPLGGFVSFPDEKRDAEIKGDDPNLLKNRPISQRAFVISAGVFANLLLAWLILIGQAAFIGLPSPAEAGVKVISVQPSEAAESSGIFPGDIITNIDEQKLGSGQEALNSFVNEIQQSPGRSLQIQGIRAGEKILLEIEPSESNGKGKIGAQLQANFNSAKTREAKDFLEVINQADSEFKILLERTIQGYKGLVTDFNSTAKQMSGPVKIVEIGAQLSQQGASGLVLFSALISINLAVLNSLPLPLLDGGQLTLLIIEGIRGKPIPENIQIIFMQTGFLLLVSLSIILIIRDTSQLSIVQNLISRG